MTLIESSTLVNRINQFLNSTRMKYPYFIGGALWIGWIISMIAGKGNTDLLGNLIGTDFAGFYSAGKIMLSGQISQLYNFDLAYSIQQALYGGISGGFNPYMNPPHYALFMAPFALIPYPWAPLLWIALGLICLWFSMKWLGVERPKRFFLWSLTWFPVFSAASFGQNSFFSLAIFSLTYYLNIRKRYLFAGLIFSILLFKPHFLICLGLLWFLDWRRSWKALAGLAIGTSTQIGLNLWFLPQASLSYLTFFQQSIPGLVRVEGSQLWHSYSVLAFWQTLIPGLPRIAQVLYLACVVVGLFFFIKFWKVNFKEQAIMFSAAIVFLVWSAPYINIYDWTILLIPAILFWNHKPIFSFQLRAVFAFIWIITLLSSILTFAQLALLTFAIQISIPSLLIALVIVYRTLMAKFKVEEIPLTMSE